ncbi:MAG: CRTAC1 family protein [Acidobacteria bacterium]|nr:CRTAC1 family protein [Acidobacteriota bacterium]
MRASNESDAPGRPARPPVGPRARRARSLAGGLGAFGALAAGLLVGTGCQRAAPATTGPELAPFEIRFEEVTERAGIRFHHERAASWEKLYVETMGAGVGWIDFDHDGLLDAYFVNSGATPNFQPEEPPQPALYRNNGDGTFTDFTERAGLRVGPGFFFFGVAAGDYDDDGYPDLYVSGYRGSLLYHNNGDGTFTDVTTEAGVGNDREWTTAAGWFDYDRDGRLDLLTTGYVQYDIDRNVVCGDPTPERRAYCHPDSFPGISPRLFRNDGDGAFTDVTMRAGLVNPDGKSLAVALADLDDDGWTDIFIANDTQRNFVYFNNGDGTFEDASYFSGAGFSEDGKTEAGMGAGAADIDDDGDIDLYVSHLDAELNRLYVNEGGRLFVDATIVSGLGATNIMNSSFGAQFLDADNDGRRDLLVINGHIMDNIAIYHAGVTYAEVKKLYRNLGRGKFADVSADQPAAFLAPRVGRGLAIGDFDNDGYADFLVNNNGERGQLFRNSGAGGGGWLGVRLVGDASVRDGTGARLELAAGSRISYDQAIGGKSYCSAQDLRILFGLGPASAADRLEIRWPSGGRQRLLNPPTDRYLTVVEGS